MITTLAKSTYGWLPLWQHHKIGKDKRGKTTSLTLENGFFNEWLALAKGYCNIHERYRGIKGKWKWSAICANNPGGTDGLHGDEGNCFP